jgi:hypothetical protein
VGFTILTDQLWLGKVQVMLASSKSASRQQAAEHCREADSWFSKCLPGFEAIRDHASPQYGGAARVNEVTQETARCKRILSNVNRPRPQ